MEGSYYHAKARKKVGEFENGVLKIRHDDDVTLYRVVDGEILDEIREETLKEINEI